MSTRVVFLRLLPLLLVSGCMTVGYHYAKDPNMVRKWDVTVVSVESQNIYNSTGVFWVGPFASVEAKGWRVTFLDETSHKVTIVQPSSNRYELRPGQRAVYVVDRGQVWVQPTDFPLPSDFGEAARSSQPDATKQVMPNNPPAAQTSPLLPPATNGPLASKVSTQPGAATNGPLASRVSTQPAAATSTTPLPPAGTGPLASKVSTQPPASTSGVARDDAARLEKLKALRDRGAITQEEYDRKKREILDAM